MFDVKPIFAALNDAGVDYVVVGGFAVILRGYLRGTADLDLAIDLSPENVERAIAALGSVGLKPRVQVALHELADPATRRVWTEQRNMIVLSLWNPHDPLQSVDVFVDQPIAYDRLRESSNAFSVRGSAVQVASIPHLIEMKTIAGRERDLNDIAHLEGILAGNSSGERGEHDI